MKLTRAIAALFGTLVLSLAGVASAEDKGENVSVAAAPTDEALAISSATVLHRPPSEAADAEPLRIVAVIENDWIENGIVLSYRSLGSDAYQQTPFKRSSAGGHYAMIPGTAVRRPGIEYFIGGATGHFASADNPHVVRVVRPADSAWIEAELHRLDGRRYSVGFDSHYQSFGSDNGQDSYVRAELDWSYRLVTQLYSISLGFGFLEGDTPASTEDDAMSLRRGYRYGYGGVRIRARESVWLDARTSLGFGDDGFSPGASAQLIVGDDWRTCVKLGAEYSTALSHRAWVTLQWDTVPGVLMSATATTTDQPKSRFDSGSYLIYEVMLPITKRLSVTGKLSYGGRGNRPGGPGLGLASEMRF